MKTIFALLLSSILLTGCTTILTGEVKPVPPGLTDPEGVVSAYPGQTYFNQSNRTLWEKVSGNGSKGWSQLL